MKETTNPDIRWQQRFANYKKALSQLRRFLEKDELNEMEIQGLIHAFEYTFELGWNCLKDYLQYQGVQPMVGARDALREAFASNVIDDGEGWIAMLVDRNQSSHSYNEETADAITANIRNSHIQLLWALKETLETFEETSRRPERKWCLSA